jgi:carboxylesterase type B
MSRALDTNSLTLLDVRAAVEWVHKNIENFGGDKENIMVPATQKPNRPSRLIQGS